MGKTKILIYDSISTGHHLDYLFYLIHQASQREGVELVLVCSEKIKKNLHDFSFPIDQYPQISFDFLDETKIEELHAKQILARSIAEWNEAIAFAHKHQVTELLFPYFDYFQLGALLGKKPKLKISGILFNANVVHPLYAFVKKMILKLVLSRHFFDTLFLLSEDALVRVKKMSPNKNIIYLPDPIFQFEENTEFKNELREKLAINPSKTVFLNFGYLDERKGILEFLEACLLLESSHQEKIHLILAGKIEERLQQRVEKFLEHCKSITVSKLFHYQLPETTQYLFELSDWTLVLYPKFLGSSSVLIRSAMANKPILGSNLGTIGKQMQEASLGISVNPENKEDIATAMRTILEKDYSIDSDALAAYTQKHSLNNFGKIVFDLSSRASGNSFI